MVYCWQSYFLRFDEFGGAEGEMLDAVAATELEVDWHLTNRCNFFCEYCHPQIRRVLNLKDLNEPTPGECIAAFDALGPSCHISMSGGEPFLFPGFIELCVGLARRHVFSINTNLSSPLIAEFADAISPDRVRRIAAALHVEERERLGHREEDYVRAYRILRDRGFSVISLYVLYPPLLSRSSSDMERLRSLGVDNIAGKVFKGRWNGRTYPDAYSEAERKMIRELTGQYAYNEPYLQGMMRFKDQACYAGATSIKVMINGEVRRCASVGGPMGNLFAGPVKLNPSPHPCTANRILVVSQCLANLVSPPVVSQPREEGYGETLRVLG
jgi:MoaA/NifB/PqqE/SkfB family radical SAM enzyme